MEGDLNWVDFGAIAVYFGLILLIGYAHSIRQAVRFLLARTTAPSTTDSGNEGTQKEGIEMTEFGAADVATGGEGGGPHLSSPGGRGSDAEGYFLSGRDMAWWAVGASLFASNIGSEHFIGLAGSGAAEGLPVSAFEWSAALLLLLLGYFFCPLYLRSRVFTTPQWIRMRYGRGLQQLLAVLSLLIYLFTKISVTLFAGGVVLQQVLGWNMWLSSVVLVVATGTYTVAGGLRAVIYTEVLQTTVLLSGGVIVALVGLFTVGGFRGLGRGLPEEFFHLFRPADHPDYPWTGVLFGIMVNSTWYWCCDQVIVQRALSAKSESQAKTGCITSGYLKLLTPFLMVLPGMISRALFPEEVRANTNIAYTLLVTRLLPHGLMGLCIASILAALMSSLASVFNSSSTIFTMDLYVQMRPSASDRELVMVGRASALVMVVAGILWIPFIGASNDQLFLYIQSVSSYLQPPVTCIFLFGALWKRTTAIGAAASLFLGSAVGLTRLVLVLSCSQETIDSDEFLQVFVGMNYLHFALFLFAICSVIIVVVSMCTQPEAGDVEGVTWSLELCVQTNSNFSSDEEADSDTHTDSEVENSRIPWPSWCGYSDHFLPPLGQKTAAATLVAIVAFLYILLR